MKTYENIRTGANVDRVELEGIGQVDYRANMPTQSWERDKAGDVLLKPGGKVPGDIDDFYIHRRGWWRPKFGDAVVTLLPRKSDQGVTYDALEFRVPGGMALLYGLIAHSIALTA